MEFVLYCVLANVYSTQRTGVLMLAREGRSVFAPGGCRIFMDGHGREMIPASALYSLLTAGSTSHAMILSCRRGAYGANMRSAWSGFVHYTSCNITTNYGTYPTYMQAFPQRSTFFHGVHQECVRYAIAGSHSAVLDNLTLTPEQTAI